MRTMSPNLSRDELESCSCHSPAAHAGKAASGHGDRPLQETLRLHSVNALGADISHRLSQPLTAIMYYCEILQQFLAAPTDGGANPASYVERIVGQVERASGIIDKVRSQVRATSETTGMIDIRATLEQAIEELQPQFARRGGRLELQCKEPLPPVRGDSEELQQVICQLVTNALEAFPSGGEEIPAVVVTAWDTAEGVRVSVADNGPGVERDRVHHIFELFETSKARHLGFGLGVSRSIVRSYGGRLWYEANPSGGAIFHFILPADTEHA